MNHLATSKEDILAASRDLIKENGWAAVSIRAVASKCSVSAGTIYNYYESRQSCSVIQSRVSGMKSFFIRKTSRYFTMSQLASRGSMNGSNTVIVSFLGSSHYIHLVL
ncbi:MAG: TetR/AcrR family transcriptional regulator [Mediterraneibacter faecis]